MNIIQLLAQSFRLSIENSRVLFVNNLFLALALFVSCGLFCFFFLVGLFGPYLLEQRFELGVFLLLFFIGFAVSKSLFFAAYGTYIYFTEQTLHLRRKVTLIEELETLDKNLAKYSLAGWTCFWPIAFGCLLAFILFFLKQELIIFFIAIFAFLLYSHLWLVYPSVIIGQKTLLTAIAESIKISKKYYIQTLLVIFAHIGLIFFGLISLVAYPFYLILITAPAYSYSLILFYKNAK
ncbi:MAG: hypothetical protein N3D10_00085 [Candidatus Micrarchaeota archaeon]|nr:hypothetical protein [Candidatus Micrarchaeota archaeon]